MPSSANDTRDTTSRIRLRRDQATMFYASCGTIIVSEQGNILIGENTHQWLGLTFAKQTLIGVGECHAVQRSGWLRLQAGDRQTADAVIFASTPAAGVSIWLRCWHWLNATPPLKE